MLKKFAIHCGLFALVFLPVPRPATAAGGAYFTNSGQQVLMGNSQIELVFSTANGGLVRLTDEATGHDFLSAKQVTWNGFTYAYTTPSNPASQYGGGFLAQEISFTPATTSAGITVTIQYGKFVSNGNPLAISATLTIAIDNVSPLTTWQLSIANQEQITIESVTLPYLGGIGPIGSDPANDYLAHPFSSGTLFQDPAHNFVANRGWGYQMYYPSGICNMQFLAYYSTESGGAGLYIAAQDTAAYTKTLEGSRGNAPWLVLSSSYVPPFQLGAGVTVPYPVAVGVFHGDWYDAATIYRSWAVNQSWVQGGTLSKRSDIPDWYKRAGITGWTFTTYWTRPVFGFGTLASIAAQWESHLQSDPVLVWTGWENQGQWIDSPDFLPPSEGWTAFDSAVAETHAVGGRFMVQPTTSNVTMGGPSWAALQLNASRQRDGSTYDYRYDALHADGQFRPQTFVQMDPTTAWHDAVLDFTSQLARHGMDVIHMDGNPSQGGLCYSKSHTHVPGGGNWWFRSYAQLYTDVRQAGRKANPNFAMGGEGQAETYIPLTDSGQDPTSTGLDPSAIGTGSVIDTKKQWYIPLWQAVYHDYILTYGQIAFLDGKDKPYYRRGLGLQLTWGEIPMVYAEAILDAYPAMETGFDPDLIRYVQRIAALRTTYGYPFVALGRMLRPPKPAVPSYTVAPATDIPYTGANTAAFAAPSILSSAWQSPQGDTALIFTNIADDAVTFTWKMTASDIPLLAGQAYDLYVLRNGICESGAQNVALPYPLALKANSTDILTAILARANAVDAPRFTGCKVAAGETAPLFAAAGLVNAANFKSEPLSPGTWFTIFGQNLGKAGQWSGANTVALGGASVSVCGLPAVISYNSGMAVTNGVAQWQLNALMPDGISASVCPVVVTVDGVASLPVSANVAPGILELFGFTSAAGPLPVLTHADYSLVGPSSAGLVPAKPSETVMAWGTGDCVTPAVWAGPARAVVTFSGRVAPGLCQLNFVIPNGVAGDTALGISTSQGTYRIWISQ